MSTRRRGGAPIALIVMLVVLVVVLAGLFFGDRYARSQVEDRAATQLQGELGTPDRPQVTIEGTPFLTQVAASSIRTVHLVADQVGQTTGAKPVTAHVDLDLDDVVSQDRFATMTVTHAEGTALIGYGQLQAVAPVPLAYVGGGRFRLDTTTSFLGQDVKATVTGGLALHAGDQTITLTDPKVEIGGVTLPDAAATALLSAVLKPIPITGLPFGLRLTSIDAQDDGLHAGVTGDNIPISR